MPLSPDNSCPDQLRLFGLVPLMVNTATAVTATASKHLMEGKERFSFLRR